MRKSILFSCIPVIFLFSCAVLSDSQLKNIHTFAATANNYSNFPGEAVIKSQQLHYNNQIFEATAVIDSNQIKHFLESSKSELEAGEDFAKKIDISLQLIQNYAVLLEQLSSDSYTDDLGNNAQELSSNLDGAIKLFNAEVSTKIPDNVASGISQVITIIGDRIIKNKQAKALKKFIPIGDTLIQITTQNLVGALDNSLKPLIKRYKNTFRDDYQKIIFNHIDKIDYNLLQFYIKTYADYADVESLTDGCISAAKKMASAHGELKVEMMKKQKLPALLKETKDFISDVKKLYKILTSLSTNN
jgi:hypothetical protein